MKKITKITCASLLAVMSVSTAIIALSKNTLSRVSGYSTSSLPTTIDLNDTSASKIRDYYSSCNGLSGDALLVQLKQVLSNGQKYYSYDSGSAIWQIYEIADRDWNKSPASSTIYGTYNSQTNKITNYQYGTSSSNSKNNPYIHALYVNRECDSPIDAWTNHQQTECGINREHIWPKSRGFDTSGSGGARGDPMHLWAADGATNNLHSNYAYGYVDKTKSYTDSQVSKKYTQYTVSGNLLGTSKTKGSGTVFEPQDDDKGDIARACFYMVARYNNLAGATTGIDTNNPNLTLEDSVYNAKQTGTSAWNESFSMGVLSDLLEWHASDPVDEYEIHRNNLLYTNYTNNRNPFVDFPEWVDYIWGGVAGSAAPATDKINGYNGGSSTVSVTGVSLNTNSTSVSVNETKQLTATIAPSNATNKNVTWISSNTTVATVSSTGLITGKQAGSATITVTTSDGNYIATCAVTVTASGGGTSSQATLYTNALAEGDYVIAYNSKAMKNTIESNRFAYQAVSPVNDVISNPDSSIIWHISQNDGYWNIYNSAVAQYAGGKSTKNQGALLSSITDYAKWTVTKNGSTFEFENYGRANGGSDVNNKYLRNNGTYGFACYASDTGGALSLYKVSESQQAISLLSVTTAGQTTEFYVGDSFIYDGTLTAHYSDSSTKTVVPTSISSPDMSSAGQKTITISYTEGGVTKSCQYTITVNNPAVAVTGVSLNANTVTLAEEETTTLTATIAPNNATNTNAEWFTSDDSIATVENGVVTAVSVGQTTISVVTEDGNYTDTCTVTVNAKERMLSANTYGTSGTEGANGGPSSISSAYPLTTGLSWGAFSNIYCYPYQSTSTEESEYVLRIGSSGASGYVTINLDIEDSYITKVVVNAKRYSSDTAKIAVNDVNAESNLTSSYTDYVFEMTNTSTTTAKVGTSQRRGYVASINVYYKHKLANQPEISFDETLYNINQGDTGLLDYTTSNAEGGVISFTSTHTNILTVDNAGNYEAVSKGVASVIVTLTIDDKEYFDITKFIVNGNATISQVIEISNEIGTGKTTEYKVSASGTVTSKSGDGTKSKNNSVYITDGENTLQVYYGYKAVSNWSDIVVGASVIATGFVQNYNGNAEISSPSIEVIEYTAESFADDLLTAISEVCSIDYDGVTSNKTALEGVWSIMSNSSHYGKLSSAQVLILASADADEDGTNIEKAMAFYDYACKKYNLTQFIEGRTIQSSNKMMSLSDGGETKIPLVMVVCGLMLTIPLAFYLFKKKPE